MSGGVDSSVAAALCKQDGYDLIGVTLKMRSCEDSRETTKSCCGLDDNIQAGLAAEKIGIPHYFLDVKKEFKDEVLRRTWREYSSARTPNPCVMCNHFIKFGTLLDYARKIGAEGIVTGHYAVLKRDENGFTRLFKGRDDKKNQVYFLAMLTQEQLRRSYMPLGELTKPETRQIADSLGLLNAQKQESQDACFGIKGENFSETLARLFNNKMPKGEIVTIDGTVVGTHDGIHNYTIGQRRGLGVALGEPAYVCAIDAETNRVVLTMDQKDLMSRGLIASNMNWLDEAPDPFDCKAQVRYNQTPFDANVERMDGNKTIVRLASPSRAVTPGQALALLKGSQLIAGGWIESSF